MYVMKKIFASAICMLLLVNCVACSKAECKHEFITEIVAQATCAKQGLERKTCKKCDTIEETKLPKTEEHAFVARVTKAATCTQDGTKIDVCSNCAFTQEGTVPALQHDYKETANVAATCTKAGSKTLTCTHCGDKKTETVAATGHKWEDYSCLAPMTCSVCKLSEGDKGPHSTIQGNCKVCGKAIHDLQDVIIPALDAMSAYLTSAKEYGSKYNAALPTQANLFYLSKAFNQAYAAIAEASYVCDALADVPGFESSYQAFYKIYELHTKLDPNGITADTVAAKYQAYTTYFPQLTAAHTAAVDALYKETAAAGISMADQTQAS